MNHPTVQIEYPHTSNTSPTYLLPKSFVFYVRGTVESIILMLKGGIQKKIFENFTSRGIEIPGLNGSTRSTPENSESKSNGHEAESMRTDEKSNGNGHNGGTKEPSSQMRGLLPEKTQETYAPLLTTKER